MLDSLRKQGRAAFLAGDYVTAESAYQQYMDAGGDDMGAILHLGICKEITGDKEAAISLYENYLSRPGGSNALRETIRGRALFREYFPAAKDVHGDIQVSQSITMSRLLGWGRFGNQLLEYFYLHVHSKVHDLTLTVPYWLGRDLFGLEDTLLTNAQAYTEQAESRLPMVQGLLPIDEGGVSFAGINLKGFCQLHTHYYSPFKDDFREVFQPIEALRQKLDQLMVKVKSRGADKLVGLHLRRTDYVGSEFDLENSQWIKSWLDSVLCKQDAMVYIASDDEKAVDEFSEFSVISARDFDIEIPGAEYLPDWWVLQHVDELAIANSTFSLTAAMLNQRATSFVRPSLDQQRMIEFDPWNTRILDRV